LQQAKNQAAYEYSGIDTCWEVVADIRSIPPHESVPQTPRQWRTKDIVWVGDLYGLAGYAKMNREIALRVARAFALRIKSERSADAAQIEGPMRDALDALSSTQLSDEALLIRGYTPRSEHSRGRRVCYTMMETETVHPDFVRRLNHAYDECWTPTEWNRRTFEVSGVRIPVEVMPLGIDPDIYCPDGVGVMRDSELLSTARVGSCERPHGFLFISLFQPSFRKGINFLLDAFEAAFEEDKEVALILATTCHPLDAARQMVRERGCKARVYGLSGRFTDHELAGVFRSCQAYVSTSLGEGWNLPLCEAAACGLPVIAGRHTAHSEPFWRDIAYLFEPEGQKTVAGSGAFCPWYEGQMFPHHGRKSREELVAILRGIKANYSRARTKGQESSRVLRCDLSWEKSAARVIAHLGKV
jgi:glycosyltransferase involved in cell wall biosynthesis